MSSETIVPLDGDPTKFLLTAEEQTRLSLIPFRDKAEGPRDPREQRRIIFLHGPPGAGKTRDAWEEYKKLPAPQMARTAYIAYDDHGALMDIKAFTDGVQKLRDEGKATQENLLANFLKHRPDSHRIRSLSLIHAIERRDDIYIDATAATRATLLLANTAKRLDYRTEAKSTWAPLGLCEERLSQRTEATGRVLEESHVPYSKREGAAVMLPVLIQSLDRVSFGFNDTPGQERRPVFETINGRRSHGVGPQSDPLLAVREMFTLEREAFAHHPHPDAAGRLPKIEAALEELCGALTGRPAEAFRPAMGRGPTPPGRTNG